MSKPFITIQCAELEFREGLPFSQQYQDIYFSSDNPKAEKQSVFIEASDLPQRFAKLQRQFVVAETGFGTGVNFLLTWACFAANAGQEASLVFISSELHPLSKLDLEACLALFPELSYYSSQLCLAYPILTPGKHELIWADGRVKLLLMLGDALDSFADLLPSAGSFLESQLQRKAVDAWFLDGFSPSKNTALWSLPICKIIAQLSAKGTTIATYTAAGQVKRNLESQGFCMQRLPGFGKKRDRLYGYWEQNVHDRGSVSQSISCGAQLKIYAARGKTPWHWNATKGRNTKTALVLGAGLAGAFTARALAERGYQVQVLDRANKPSGASGIAQGVLFPHFSAFDSSLGKFMLKAYGFALNCYRQIINKTDLGQLQGVAYLIAAEKLKNLRQQDRAFFECYPDLAQLKSADALSALAGIPLCSGGLFMPNAGYLQVNALCQYLLNAPNIVFAVEEARQLIYEQGLWQIGSFQAENLILANGLSAVSFAESRHLPLKAIRGQCTQIPATTESLLQRIPICGEAYILPAEEGRHWLGSTYQLKRLDTSCYAEDDTENCAALAQLSAITEWDLRPYSHYAGIRATCPDYLPMVGPVPIEAEFRERFARFITDANAWIPESGSYYPGLYLIAGFGSRGLTSIPLAAECLAAEINQEFPLIGRDLSQALSPARFLKRDLSRTRKRS